MGYGVMFTAGARVKEASEAYLDTCSSRENIAITQEMAPDGEPSCLVGRWGFKKSAKPLYYRETCLKDKT